MARIVASSVSCLMLPLKSVLFFLTRKKIISQYADEWGIVGTHICIGFSLRRHFDRVTDLSHSAHAGIHLSNVHVNSEIGYSQSVTRNKNRLQVYRTLFHFGAICESPLPLQNLKNSKHVAKSYSWNSLPIFTQNRNKYGYTGMVGRYASGVRQRRTEAIRRSSA